MKRRPRLHVTPRAIRAEIVRAPTSVRVILGAMKAPVIKRRKP